jgi:hypothetical protein
MNHSRAAYWVTSLGLRFLGFRASLVGRLVIRQPASSHVRPDPPRESLPNAPSPPGCRQPSSTAAWQTACPRVAPAGFWATITPHQRTPHRFLSPGSVGPGSEANESEQPLQPAQKHSLSLVIPGRNPAKFLRPGEVTLDPIPLPLRPLVQRFLMARGGLFQKSLAQRLHRDTLNAALLQRRPPLPQLRRAFLRDQLQQRGIVSQPDHPADGHRWMLVGPSPKSIISQHSSVNMESGTRTIQRMRGQRAPTIHGRSTTTERPRHW